MPCVDYWLLADNSETPVLLLLKADGDGDAYTSY